MFPQESAPILDYTVLDHDIHCFRFMIPSYRAIDLWAAQLEIITTTTPHDVTVRYIFDVTVSGMMPISYAYKRVREIMDRHPERASVRVAIIHAPSLVVPLVDAFVQLLYTGNKDRVRYFKSAQIGDATAWLLGED